eukprot:580843-Pyramimonas_sp.AAC.1
MGSRLDNHIWRRRRRHKSHVRMHGLIATAHVCEAVELIRHLTNKLVRDPGPVRVQRRIHVYWRRSLALGHARVSIKGWDKGSLPSRIPWVGAIRIPGPSRPPPLATRVRQ